MPDSSTDQFFVQARDRTIGPLTLSQLERLERRNQVLPTDLVSRNRVDWHPLSELEELYPPAAPAADPQSGESGETVGSGETSPDHPPPGPPQTTAAGPSSLYLKITLGLLLAGGLLTGVIVVFRGGRSDEVSNPPPSGPPAGNLPVATAPEVSPDTASQPAPKKASKPHDPGTAKTKTKTKTAKTKTAKAKGSKSKGGKTKGGKAKTAGSPTGLTRTVNVSAFLPLPTPRPGEQSQLPLRELPDAPTLEQISSVLLIGPSLMDELLELQSQDGGRTLLLLGTPAAEGEGRDKVPLAALKVGEAGLTLKWSLNESIVRRLQPQLQWCAVAVRYADGRSVYIGLRRPTSETVDLRRVGRSVQAPLAISQLTESATRRLRIGTAKVVPTGDPDSRQAYRITAHGGSDLGAAPRYQLEEVGRLLADRGLVTLNKVERAGREELRLAITLSPSLEDLRASHRSATKESGRKHSLAKLALKTIESRGSKGLVTTTSVTTRRFLTRDLALKIPAKDAAATELAGFATAVRDKCRKIVGEYGKTIERLTSQQKQINRRRGELSRGRPVMEVYTVIRDRDVGVRVPVHRLLP